LREEASGKRFLNLFGYTGTATVYATAGGARETVTVDLSRTYLDWARRNMALNGFNGKRHSFERADCFTWLETARRKKLRYDLIFLDPPVFSRSKAMDRTLDVQRDYAELIRQSAGIMEPDGVLFFSTNLKTFKLDENALSGLSAENITARTIPRDFARSPKIHQVWRITKERRGREK
jgi:23S rRNA (guanine2445-N2)-methyltransferase / 23S rRNA (guanine2069-N7)-methyltransferase